MNDQICPKSRLVILEESDSGFRRNFCTTNILRWIIEGKVMSMDPIQKRGYSLDDKCLICAQLLMFSRTKTQQIDDFVEVAMVNITHHKWIFKYIKNYASSILYFVTNVSNNKDSINWWLPPCSYDQYYNKGLIKFIKN